MPDIFKYTGHLSSIIHQKTAKLLEAKIEILQNGKTKRFHMAYFQNETKQNMENAYDTMTPVEHSIADFFIKNTEKMDFSSKSISNRLYVSEATLSRFAKKCGYKGYREFIFSYVKDLVYEIPNENNEQDISLFTRKVKGSYNSLLQETFKLLDENQMRRIAGMLSESRRVFIYGMGSSGLVAREFQLRFMRIGLDADAITDSQMMQMSAALAEKGILIIAISLSGKTKEVIESIKIAKKSGAQVIFITANSGTEVSNFCDELLQVAYLKNLDTGTKISPQFSLLVVIDVLYSYYFANDSYFKAKKYNVTLSAIKGNKEGKKNES